MSDEPDTPIDAGQATKLDHERYFLAVNNPFRKKILEMLQRGRLTAEELSQLTGLNREDLYWHLSILVSALCVEIERAHGTLFYKLTQAGRVVRYLGQT